MDSGDNNPSFNRRILIVDDNADIHNDFRKILGASKKQARVHLNSIEMELFADEQDQEELIEDIQIEYDLGFALQGEDAVAMVDEAHAADRPYAMCFMDVRMPPGIDGIETIKRIWDKYPTIEMVICTAYSDYSFDGILEKLGTSDHLLFLTKPFDSIAVKQMAHSLTYKWNLHDQARKNVLLLEAEIAQRKESERRLAHMINHDALTGLANRHMLGLKLDEAIVRARADATRFGLFFVEIDRFREVIDTLGYQIGDKLILKIAARLQNTFSEISDVFRLGQTEFALLLRSITSREQNHRVAATIQSTFEQSFDLGDLNIDVSPKIGIVIYPDNGCNRDMLMRHADMTLLHARLSETGYSFFDEEMNEFSPQRLTLLTELRHAIQDNELMLYFQPKISLKAGQVTGVEALLRWPHPRLGFISPSAFIPMAERCGLIRPLTRWVLENVAEQWLVWHNSGLDFSVSVNLTAHDLQDPHLPDHVTAILDAKPMATKRLVFEVTERSVMADPDQAVAMLHRIREMGIRVSIDNFGRGYSSLAYLKKLPLNRIKIDQTFVKDLVGNQQQIAIVKSMVDLGHNLGLEVVAEGVSSEDSYDLLRELGCDFIQGQLINSPVPSGELMLWLNEASWDVSRLQN